ncbi:MAG: SAM-dependent methyltransferase [Alphaproteobacteria bacterium]|jgi:hypothetical protein|nr:SAM-dependent methyltransferase [Alphaproteobacteria bacterium]
MTVALIVLAVEIALLIPLFVYMAITGISPVPTSRRARRAALAALPGRLDGTLYELGAGWGTVAFPLAQAFPDNRVVAIELSPVPCLFMWLRARLTRRPNLVIRRRDFLEQPLGDAGLVFVYQYPDMVTRLEAKFEAELSPGTPVVLNGCPLPGWAPQRTTEVNDLILSNLFVYRAPGRENPEADG